MEKKVPLWQEKGARTPQVGPGAWPSVLRTLRVVGAFPVPRGAAPRCPPGPGQAPAFFGRKPEERTPGRKRFFLPGPTFSGWGDPGGFSLFFCLACGPVSYVRNGPPPGWAGWGRWFLRREGKHSPKPSPWGEGAPVRTLGADEGAILYPTFPCRNKKGGCRLSPQRNFSSAPLGNPVAPSSVTFGDSFPTRGSLWVVQPYTKKAPQIRARRWAPK